MSDSPTCASGNPCQFSEELHGLKEEVSKLSEMVSTDNLTGLFNYRHFCTVIVQELERSKRTNQATTVIMVDADHFKSVNDTWGHEVGNKALKMIADCLERNTRKLDIACRYGGEEFIVILPSTDLITSVTVAERIREMVANTPVPIEGEADLNLTVSLGIATYSGKQEESWQHLVVRADSQLYQAKEEGRNCVCYEPEEESEQQVTDEEKSALFDIFK